MDEVAAGREGLDRRAALASGISLGAAGASQMEWTGSTWKGKRLLHSFTSFSRIDGYEMVDSSRVAESICMAVKEVPWASEGRVQDWHGRGSNLI